MSESMPPAGWYNDGVTPGVMRWFDGAAWTEHVQQLQQAPVAPQAPGSPQAPVYPQAPGSPQPTYGQQPSFSQQPAYGHQPTHGQQPWAGQPAYAAQPSYAGQPTYAAQQAWGPQPSQPAGNGPGSVAHWLVPVGRSWQSMLAGYLGLFGWLIFPLAPFAIGFGVWALVRARRGGHGTGRAIVGILGGLLGLVVAVYVLGGGLTGSA